MDLYLATGNAHKAEEFGRMFAKAGLPFRVHSAAELGGMPYVEEITGTFTGNCRLKAEALRRIAPAKSWVLADDSGLCCDALQGGPGVDSAVYAGSKATDAENRAKLLLTMKKAPPHKRGARCTEIDSAVADDPVRSVIKEQVEMGVAVRMAVLDTLSRGEGRNEP
jgi:XTP/dITP diphosphohydrolase